MPRQNSFLKIFLNHSPNFYVFGIIISSNKLRRVEGVSFNPPTTKSKNLRDQNNKVETGSRLSWSYNKIFSQNKMWKLGPALN